MMTKRLFICVLFIFIELAFTDSAKAVGVYGGWGTLQFDFPTQEETVQCTSITCQPPFSRGESISADAAFHYGFSGGIIFKKTEDKLVGFLLGGDLGVNDEGYNISSKIGFAFRTENGKSGIAPYGKVGYAKIATDCKDAVSGYCDVPSSVRASLPADFEPETIEKGENFGGGVLLMFNTFVIDIGYSNRTKLSIGVGFGRW